MTPSSRTPSGTPAMPPIRNGSRRRQLWPRRTAPSDTSCATSEPNTTMGDSRRGSSTQAHTLSPIMPNAKPDRPATNAAPTVPTSTARTTPIVTSRSCERQRRAVVRLLEREARLNAGDPRDAGRVLEQEAGVDDINFQTKLPADATQGSHLLMRLH